MSQPFLGQLKMFAGSSAPQGWQLCDGTLLSIAENDALFQLLGTTFGGDGFNTFGVPDLRGRVPIGPGTDVDRNVYASGTVGGTELVGLTEDNVPSHSHPFVVSTADGNLPAPGGNVLGTLPEGVTLYRPVNPTGSLATSIAPSTGTPHENRQPYLPLNFIIATVGIYPSQG